MSVDQETGVILPGQFVEVDVDYVSHSLYQGNYDANLTVYDTTQAPEQALSVFHLTLQVYCAALDISQPAVVRTRNTGLSSVPLCCL